MAKVLEKKSSTSHEKLQSLVSLFFAIKVVCLGQIFFRRLYNALAKGGKYLHWFKSIRDDLL